MQQESLQAAQWEAADYARLAEDPNGMLLVAENAAGQVLGFAAAQRVAGEAELRNLAVEPGSQGRGVGRALLEEVKGRLRAAGVKSIYLEVRASNQRALALYYGAGYVLSGRRKDYYHCPSEDALILRRELSERANEPGVWPAELT